MSRGVSWRRQKSHRVIDSDASTRTLRPAAAADEGRPFRDGGAAIDCTISVGAPRPLERGKIFSDSDTASVAVAIIVAVAVIAGSASSPTYQCVAR